MRNFMLIYFINHAHRDYPATLKQPIFFYFLAVFITVGTCYIMWCLHACLAAPVSDATLVCVNIYSVNGTQCNIYTAQLICFYILD